MPVEYEVYDSGKYVYAKASGTLKPEEIVDYIQKTKSDPKIKEGYKELFDVRFITESEVKIESFAEIIKKITANEKITYRNKLAIVVSKLDSFERAKYFEKTVPDEKQSVIVFNTLETAKTWLGVDKP
jgi:hypothetical protein